MQADQDKDTSTMRFSEAQSKVESTASALLATASMHSRKMLFLYSCENILLLHDLWHYALELFCNGEKK